MTYLALGDSVSIDSYTGLVGGGAASQLARRLGADPFIDLTRDGMTTDGLLAYDLSREDLPKVDCATVTIGGNDLLSGFFRREIGDRGSAEPRTLEQILQNMEVIADRLVEMRCLVVISTIYDPTDGDDARAVELGLGPEAREALTTLNGGIRRIADERGFLLCDLAKLFEGHGFWSTDPWLVMHIEPNLKGATEIARAWCALLKDQIAERY